MLSTVHQGSLNTQEWAESGQHPPNLFLQDADSNILEDDIRFVNTKPSEIDPKQLWRVSFVYYLLQWASRHDCLVHPPCSHIDELWLQLIEGDDSDHDIWLWVEGDEAWIRENALIGSDRLELEERQWNSARQALRRRLERTQRASYLGSQHMALRNRRIRAATPEQRFAAMTWLINTSKRGEELDSRCGWSSRSKFSLGELIRTWRDEMMAVFGALPTFPEQPETWKMFMEGRERIGCTCMESESLLLRESVPDWLRMVTWLEGTNLDVDFLDPCQCRSCKDRASAEYDVFYNADHFWETPPVSMLLVVALEALSFLDNSEYPAMLPFAMVMVSRSLFPGSRSVEDAKLRGVYDGGDKDVELSPWVNSHPGIGRKYLERYACCLGCCARRTETVRDFLDDYLIALPPAFAQGAPSLVVLIGTLAWILGSRFLDQSSPSRWHDYWEKVLSGDFMEGFGLQMVTQTTLRLQDKLRQTNSSAQDSCCGKELKWDDDLWTNYAAIMEFVKSRIPDPQFRGCPKCHAVYISAVDNATPVSGTSDQYDTNAVMLQKHFGHIPNLSNLVKRLSDFPVATGAYADIYKCRLRDENDRHTIVAVKVFRPGSYVGPQLETPRGLRREIKVWHVLRHRNIIPLLGVVTGFGTHVSAVSPWVSGGPLYTYLERRSEELSLFDRYKLIGDVTEGIKCLHSFPIVHGDLSDGNILVEADGTARLSDFGLCTVIGGVSGGSSMVRQTICLGTAPFAAPELLINGDTVSPSMMSDIYSLGCLMLQILSGRQPWERASPPMISIALSRGECVPRPEHQPICDRDWAFIQRCCFAAADIRPSISEVLDYVALARDESQTLSTASASSSGTHPYPKTHTVYGEVEKSRPVDRRIRTTGTSKRTSLQNDRYRPYGVKLE